MYLRKIAKSFVEQEVGIVEQQFEESCEQYGRVLFPSPNFHTQIAKSKLRYRP